jgi:4-hydroxy 2-oxovalerate aldolase
LKSFDILDCTLRDGGYYTNWDFSKELLECYFDAVCSLPIRYVEVGYRSPEKSGYLGQFFHLNPSTLQQLRKMLRPDQGMAIMFNYKDMTDEVIDRLTSDLEGVVDLVRFACPPDQIDNCIAFSKPIKTRGIKVGINVMYMTKYAGKATDVLYPLASAAEIVDYVALVDSYGGIMPNQASETIAQAVELLPQPIGYHGHDNLSLAFANSIAALSAGATMLDSTFTGMGRGAGNLKTELITVYRERHFPTDVHFGKLARALDLFEAMQKNYGWGTNLAYMVSGAASLPQANVMDWLSTRRYQMDSIVEALRLDSDAALDRVDYPDFATSAFADKMRGRAVLIVGGGGSVVDHAEALISFARQENLTLIHSSMRNASRFLASGLSQVFCLAGQEYSRLSEHEVATFAQEDVMVLTSPAPRFRNSVPENAEICQISFTETDPDPMHLGPVTDEPPLDMALSAALACAAPQVYLAGFDGYGQADRSEQNNARDVQNAIDRARAADTFWHGRICSVTPTLYDVECQSLYAKIQTGAAE